MDNDLPKELFSSRHMAVEEILDNVRSESDEALKEQEQEILKRHEKLKDIAGDMNDYGSAVDPDELAVTDLVAGTEVETDKQ